MSRSMRSDRSLGMEPAALVPAGDDAQAATGEVARMAPSLSSSVAGFRY